MTSGIWKMVKKYWYGLLFFSFSDICCACILMSTFTQCFLLTFKTKKGEIKHIQRKGQIPYTGMYCRDQRNQAFKDCSEVIRLVVIVVIRLAYAMCSVTKVGLFGTRKTYENLSSFFFKCFTWQESEDINIESNIFCQMCNPQTWVVFHQSAYRGCSEASFKELFQQHNRHGKNTLNFPHDFQVPLLVGLLLSHRSQEASHFLEEKASALLHPHYWLLSSWSEDSENVNVSNNNLHNTISNSPDQTHTKCSTIKYYINKRSM